MARRELEAQNHLPRVLDAIVVSYLPPHDAWECAQAWLFSRNAVLPRHAPLMASIRTMAAHATAASPDRLGLRQPPRGRDDKQSPLQRVGEKCRDFLEHQVSNPGQAAIDLATAGQTLVFQEPEDFQPVLSECRALAEEAASMLALAVINGLEGYVQALPLMERRDGQPGAKLQLLAQALRLLRGCAVPERPRWQAKDEDAIRGLLKTLRVPSEGEPRVLLRAVLDFALEFVDQLDERTANLLWACVEKDMFWSLHNEAQWACGDALSH